jgi:hypothetical protein
MVKYGKLFRELQITEFKGNYINYKKLKQKIKEIQELLPRTSQQLMKNRASNVSTMKLRPTIQSEKDDYDSYENANDQYGDKLKEFKLLLDEEFQRCYKYFKSMRKQLHNKLNRHLYTQTNYLSYNLEQILKEVKNLQNTTYLAKCLNAFINDNMKAIKKILKKFDKKFSNYFGNIGPKYILDNLTKQNSELEYLLQFKIIDEASCICESNLKLLSEYFKEFCNSNKVDNISKNEFELKANKILEYIRDIDELIYFKIQYKEWFYYTKKDAPIISNSNLFKNIMFNPILFSAYHKDDLMNKFLSRKDQIKEIEHIQLPLSTINKINITLIFIQTFFYNTLISGIYPILFELMGETNDNSSFIPYSLLIIASTYIFSYFSIMFYHYFGTKNIKAAYTISYILFFIGSIAYILCYRNDDLEYIVIKDGQIFRKTSLIGFLLFSRIVIGLGANPTMGKRYILNYASKYFLPFISKIYVIISILGHSMGPLIGFFLYDINDYKFFEIIYYSKYNCIGWYGLIMSFILLLTHLFLFTSPFSHKFSRLKEKKKTTHYGTMTSQDTPFLDDDIEDTQDKEFYKLQREMKIKVSTDNNFEQNDEVNSYTDKNVKNLRNLSGMNENIDIGDEDLKSEGKNKEEMNIDNLFIKSSTLEVKDIRNIEENIKTSNNYEINPLLISTNSENIKDETQEEGSFTNINMIPRTIDDLIRKEKKTFGYLNKNLLIILIILFFDNLLKENFVAYCSYYIYYSITYGDDGKKKGEEIDNDSINVKYLSCLISLSYLLEIFSIPFILPFYRINTLIKKSLITLMILTVLLMIPLSIQFICENIYIYFIIISCVFLISSIIEVLSSCYLAYLTPPEWVFSQINAGALPLFVMTFGKLCGCLICLTAFTKILLFNHHIVIGLTLFGYGISGIFILKSKNFRIKAIARIMRKSELEQNFI